MNKTILITGGTGFIGTALTQALRERGDSVYILSRRRQRDEGGVHYISRLEDLAGVIIDGVINLAGEPLAAKRWNAQRKAEFVRSRVSGTADLLGYFKQQSYSPKVVISGSAIGFYGATDDTSLSEGAAQGTGFAADLCAQWEQQAQGFSALGSRLCIARIGVVLGANGGAFTEMRRSFDMKLASQLGSGQQWLSWIHLRDMVQCLIFLLDNKDCTGVFNCTAPTAVTNKQFTQAMKQATGSFISLPVPSFALRALVGEMADELLLVGQRVTPQQLLGKGFSFTFPTIESAIEDILTT